MWLWIAAGMQKVTAACWDELVSGTDSATLSLSFSVPIDFSLGSSYILGVVRCSLWTAITSLEKNTQKTTKVVNQYHTKRRAFPYLMWTDSSVGNSVWAEKEKDFRLGYVWLSAASEGGRSSKESAPRWANKLDVPGVVVQTWMNCGETWEISRSCRWCQRWRTFLNDLICRETFATLSP